MNEFDENDVIEEGDEEEIMEEKGMSSGLAMGIGAGIALAGVAAVKGVKKLWKKIKDKKEVMIDSENSGEEVVEEDEE